jgi:hypothetical protein
MSQELKITGSCFEISQFSFFLYNFVTNLCTNEISAGRTAYNGRVSAMEVIQLVITECTQLFVYAYRSAACVRADMFTVDLL